ncbi:cytochrome c oxidase assembly protein COX16 homolog, mitochondrial isoform X2 [Cephus cinctus]|uniref:Cytochrome c oxidase assembly protein COX16 homolog, mitochondrial n=1 Tax=Cephus cinctus TaxID=211228 RepID=A0AAJ7BJ33_CEPCN|nr:cytochrome c oxidase assembly protein COX16 homolog, mitochondrial isoform X2 [Cephus cinctus]XP_015586883.1 cytochrome c oxidase assembly protein COX16 homolog, mitochondrial isoform X2 [Cephus cinctus]
MYIPKFFQKKLVKLGVPFMVLILGGSFGLREFTELKYKYSNVEGYSVRDEASKHGINIKKREEVTLESEFEKVQNVDIENWENVRGPRPWEGNYQRVQERG